MSYRAYIAYINNVMRSVEGYEPVVIDEFSPVSSVVALASDMDDLFYMDDLLQTGGAEEGFIRSYDFLYESLSDSLIDRYKNSGKSPEIIDSITDSLNSLDTFEGDIDVSSVMSGFGVSNDLVESLNDGGLNKYLANFVGVANPDSDLYDEDDDLEYENDSEEPDEFDMDMDDEDEFESDDSEEPDEYEMDLDDEEEESEDDDSDEFDMDMEDEDDDNESELDDSDEFDMDMDDDDEDDLETDSSEDSDEFDMDFEDDDNDE